MTKGHDSGAEDGPDAEDANEGLGDLVSEGEEVRAETCASGPVATASAAPLKSRLEASLRRRLFQRSQFQRTAKYRAGRDPRPLTADFNTTITNSSGRLFFMIFSPAGMNIGSDRFPPPSPRRTFRRSFTLTRLRHRPRLRRRYRHPEFSLLTGHDCSHDTWKTGCHMLRRPLRSIDGVGPEEESARPCIDSAPGDIARRRHVGNAAMTAISSAVDGETRHH